MNAFAHGYALLIAVDKNKSSEAALPQVANDVAALQRVLGDPNQCGYRTDNIKCISGEASTLDGIREGFAWLKTKIATDANATALVYYTGHGLVYSGRYYFVPYNFNADNPRTGMEGEEFSELVASLKPKRLLTLLDCCHAQGMGAKGFEAAPVGKAFPSAAPSLDMLLSDGTNVLPDAARQGQSKDLNSALGQDSGRFVISSCKEGEKSYIQLSGEKPLSVFTAQLIEALVGHATISELEAGVKGVRVFDIARHVASTVPDAAKAAGGAGQHPHFRLDGGDFPVALVAGGKGVSKGDLAPSSAEAVARAPMPPVSINAESSIVNVNSSITGDQALGNMNKVAGNSGIVMQGSTVHGSVVQGNYTQGVSAADLTNALAPIYAALDGVPNKREAAAKLDEIKAEAAKGKQENDDKLSDLVDDLANLMPNAVSAIVSVFGGGPLAAIAGSATKAVVRMLIKRT